MRFLANDEPGQGDVPEGLEADVRSGLFFIMVVAGLTTLGAALLAADRTGPAVTVEPSFVDCKLRTGYLLDDARRRIQRGDLACAREILSTPGATRSAAMTFLLAQTYDPMMLAAWQIRDGDSIHRAKALYEKARELGHPDAQLRIDRLLDNWPSAFKAQ